METSPTRPATAFEGRLRLASGPLREVALAVKAALERTACGPILTFDDATGGVIDLDTRGSDEEVLARLDPPAPARGRGRPRLGVVPREVTLLPRHWDWLNTQPGGASVALRRLVEEARRAQAGPDRRRAAQEAAYRFMSAMAGDEPGYEEALRALFAGDPEAFDLNTRAWPGDVRATTLRLAQPALSRG
ncbi:DUF2239 family protein [Mesoterricola silvestris]|uniref:DUF2239 family protein n=1 Tax=Mesoterricola silvestris TaxID=2927979 RepID=A0AA48K9F6_9BACT|nr:DUF2239 family protein [Mesoterricola silvestris]BDU73954.1 hypothetical protein METEAL_31280 [Mesoterricola silvestris]